MRPCQRTCEPRAISSPAAHQRQRTTARRIEAGSDGTPSLRQHRNRLRNQRGRKSRMAAAISAACVSSAKWPVSKKRTTASGMSRLNASAPGGRKNGSFLPHTAKKRRLVACGNTSGRSGRARRCSCSRRTGRAAARPRRAGSGRSYRASSRPARPPSRRGRRACIARRSSRASGTRAAPRGWPATRLANRPGSGSSRHSDPPRRRCRSAR